MRPYLDHINPLESNMDQSSHEVDSFIIRDRFKPGSLETSNDSNPDRYLGLFKLCGYSFHHHILKVLPLHFLEDLQSLEGVPFGTGNPRSIVGGHTSVGKNKFSDLPYCNMYNNNTSMKNNKLSVDLSVPYSPFYGFFMFWKGIFGKIYGKNFYFLPFFKRLKSLMGTWRVCSLNLLGIFFGGFSPERGVFHG